MEILAILVTLQVIISLDTEKGLSLGMDGIFFHLLSASGQISLQIQGKWYQNGTTQRLARAADKRLVTVRNQVINHSSTTIRIN